VAIWGSSPDSSGIALVACKTLFFSSMVLMGKPLRCRRIIGGGVALSVNAFTRWIFVWVVCIQSSSWRLNYNNNNNNNNSDDASTTTTTNTKFLVVEGTNAAFFRPFGVLSSVFMGGERPRTLPSTTAAASAAQASRTETDTKHDEDENTAIDLQQQQASQFQDEEVPTDDDMDKENIDNNNTSDRINSAGNNKENE
jgi:hypothetical protein